MAYSLNPLCPPEFRCYSRCQFLKFVRIQSRDRNSTVTEPREASTKQHLAEGGHIKARKEGLLFWQCFLRALYCQAAEVVLQGRSEVERLLVGHWLSLQLTRVERLTEIA